MRKITLLLLLIFFVAGCASSEQSEQTTQETTSMTEVQTATTTTEVATQEKTEADSAAETTPMTETMSVPETTVEATEAEAETETEPVTTTAIEPETTVYQHPMNWAELNEDRFQVDEVKALWLTYLDLQPVFENNSELGFKAAMRKVVNNTKDLGLNTIMFQVRPFGDALYASELFPTSYIISGSEGAPLPYDPLEVMIKIAHAEGIRVEAWINPYRVRTKTSSIPMSENNIAKMWLEDGSRRVLQSAEGTIVYNPSNDEAKARIIDGVKEIIYGYSVDGIHFDDYFYPTADMTFDEVEYLGFLHDSDDLSQADWRRYNVNELIAGVYEAIQLSEGNLVFGISPQGTIESNYEQLYADVRLWLSEPGYLDYVVPQIYFGFDNGHAPYSETLAKWHQLNQGGAKVIPGIAVYKVGKEDQWAGEGALEWVEHVGIISAMIQEAESYEGYKGFALYRYDFLFKPAPELIERMTEEIDLIKSFENGE